MSKRCLPVIGSIDRSCSVQKVISLAVCFGSRVYTRLRLSGAWKMSGDRDDIELEGVLLFE
jgi:hypothetical protein